MYDIHILHNHSENNTVKEPNNTNGATICSGL